MVLRHRVHFRKPKACKESPSSCVSRGTECLLLLLSNNTVALGEWQGKRCWGSHCSWILVIRLPTLVLPLEARHRSYSPFLLRFSPISPLSCFLGYLYLHLFLPVEPLELSRPAEHPCPFLPTAAVHTPSSLPQGFPLPVPLRPFSTNRLK